MKKIIIISILFLAAFACSLLARERELGDYILKGDIDLYGDEKMVVWRNKDGSELLGIVTIRASDSLATDYNMVWPSWVGEPNSVMMTNGAGVLSWTPFDSNSIIIDGNEFSLPAKTPGSVIFVDANGYPLREDNAYFYWDDANNVFHAYSAVSNSVTVTDAAVIGANSSIFQPAADSTTFFQVKQADGTTFIVGDTTNKELEITGTGIFGAADTLGIDLSNITESTHNNSTTMLKLSNYTCGASESGGPYYSGFSILNSSGTQRELFNLFSDIGTTTIFGGGVNGENYRRIKITTSGGFRWSNGSTSIYDWELERTNATAITFNGNSSTRAKVAVNNKDTSSGSNSGFGWMVEDSSKWTMGCAKDNSYNMVLSNTFSLANPLYTWDYSNPYYTLHNLTHEDTDGGRESRLNFKGEQSGGEETTLARIEVSHDGSADDQKGQEKKYFNDGDDGDSPTHVATWDSDGLTVLGDVNATGFTGDLTADTVDTNDLTIDGDHINIATRKTPSSSSDSGNEGDFAFDGDYVYGYVAGAWRRAAWGAWPPPAENVVYEGENVIYAGENVVYQ